MNLSESYKKRLQELAGVALPDIEINEFQKIVNEVIERTKFLKYYNQTVIKGDDGIGINFQKQECFGEKSQQFQDKIIYMDEICAVSEFRISYRHFNEKKWYFINFKNEMFPTISRKTELEDLERTVFMKMMQIKNRNYEYTKELMLNEDEKLSQEIINEIVNEIIKKTFSFEEYLSGTFREEKFYE